MAPKHKRKGLSEAFQDLDINKTQSNSAMNPPHLGKSIRLMMASSLLGRGTVRAKSIHDIEASFTISMDEAYDYNLVDDPDVLHSQLQQYIDDVAQGLKSHLAHENALDDYFIDTLAHMVFGSNMIETAGAGLDITLNLCRAIFQGEKIQEISDHDPEYEVLKRDLIRNNLPHGIEAVLRSRREIVQHALALQYIIQEVYLSGKDLSETIILETHRILTHKVDADQGMSWTQYSGVYRQWPVRTGLHQYMDASMVPSAMREMIQSLKSDLQAAIECGEIDPIALAAKYCHTFVNIHPFLDSNGRMCRLILNAILLKYGGTLVCIGEAADDRREYLQIASRSSYMEGSQQEDIDDLPENLKPKHYKELASFTLRHARNSIYKLKEILKKHH